MSEMLAVIMPQDHLQGRLQPECSHRHEGGDKHRHAGRKHLHNRVCKLHDPGDQQAAEGQISHQQKCHPIVPPEQVAGPQTPVAGPAADVTDDQAQPIEDDAKAIELHVLPVQAVRVALHDPLGVDGCQGGHERTRDAPQVALHPDLEE